MLADFEEYDRTEVIDGVEYQMSPPNMSHVVIRGNIESIFRQYLKGKRCRAFSEAGLYLENGFLIPDIMIVCDRDKIKADGIHGTPDLVVEILSPSTGKKDRSVKLKTYEKAGVKEYWIVSPKAKSVEVYKLQDGHYELDELYHSLSQEEWDMMDEKDRKKIKLSLKVSLYDDLEISLRDIFEDL